MSDETRLTDFLESEDGPNPDPDSEARRKTAEAERAEAGGDDESANRDGLESEAGAPAATVTYAWGPEGRCERCEGAAPRRFRDGAELVCESCKRWD